MWRYHVPYCSQTCTSYTVCVYRDAVQYFTCLVQFIITDKICLLQVPVGLLPPGDTAADSWAFFKGRGGSYLPWRLYLGYLYVWSHCRAACQGDDPYLRRSTPRRCHDSQPSILHVDCINRKNSCDVNFSIHLQYASLAKKQRDHCRVIRSMKTRSHLSHQQEDTSDLKFRKMYHWCSMVQKILR